MKNSAEENLKQELPEQLSALEQNKNICCLLAREIEEKIRLFDVKKLQDMGIKMDKPIYVFFNKPIDPLYEVFLNASSKQVSFKHTWHWRKLLFNLTVSELNKQPFVFFNRIVVNMFTELNNAIMTPEEVEIAYKKQMKNLHMLNYNPKKKKLYLKKKGKSAFIEIANVRLDPNGCLGFLNVDLLNDKLPHHRCQTKIEDIPNWYDIPTKEEIINYMKLKAHKQLEREMAYFDDVV